MTGRPFEGDSGLTAERYLVKHLRFREKLFLAVVVAWAMLGPVPRKPAEHASLSGRNKPPPRWLRLTPWESWRPKIWKRSA